MSNATTGPGPSVAHSFAASVKALRREANASLGEEDLRHLRRLEWRGRLCTLLGYATAWIAPNPISAYLISHGNYNRWMVAHHVLHRGYDKVPGVPAQRTSKRFAAGLRRYVDWFDWIHPEAWVHEHNVLHHYHTGERADPDLVERNMQFLRRSKMSPVLKLLVVAYFALTWKLTYYAPSTMRQLQNERRRRAGEPEAQLDSDFTSLFKFWTRDGWELYARCILPYGLFRFALLPALFLLISPWAALSVLCSSVIAEAMTNVHSFVTIAPNHSGDDLVRFDAPTTDPREFYARQVTGTVNFNLGSELVDWMHGFLNYQIEHHLWPDLPMLKYRQLQPKARQLCESHALPYVQEPVSRRLRKLTEIMIGQASMKRRRQRPAVDGHEGPATAAGLVNGAGQELLAGAAVHQERHRRAGHALQRRQLLGELGDDGPEGGATARVGVELAFALDGAGREPARALTLMRDGRAALATSGPRDEETRHRADA